MKMFASLCVSVALIFSMNTGGVTQPIGIGTSYFNLSQFLQFVWQNNNSDRDGLPEVPENPETVAPETEPESTTPEVETAPLVPEETIPTVPEDTGRSENDDIAEETDPTEIKNDLAENATDENNAGDENDTAEEGEYVVYTGDSAGIDAYLDQVVSKGIYEIRFEGTYTINKKITIPAGLKIVGGTFVADPSFEDAMFSAQGDNIQLVRVTLKAPALDKVPSIFVGNDRETDSKDSNVVGLYSNGHEGIALINCVTDKIIPSKINNGSGIIKDCTIMDCSMFAWATNCQLKTENNDVYICDTGLDYYYHVYYLDQNSVLTSKNNRIRIDTTVPYFDIYHLMTKGNKGTYWASGVVDGDVVTGNYQHIIDCHYADLILKNCEFTNSNPGEWSEISNWGHVSYTYQNCTIDLCGSVIKDHDVYRDAEVIYDGCRIQKTTCLDRQRIYKNCEFEMYLDGKPLLTNHSDVYNCKFNVSGTPTGIAIISDATFEFDFVENIIVFENSNTSNYLMKCTKFTGICRDNTVTGAKTTKWWHTDRGNTYGNIVNGKAAT